MLSQSAQPRATRAKPHPLHSPDHSTVAEAVLRWRRVRAFVHRHEFNAREHRRRAAHGEPRAGPEIVRRGESSLYRSHPPECSSERLPADKRDKPLGVVQIYFGQLYGPFAGILNPVLLQACGCGSRQFGLRYDSAGHGPNVKPAFGSKLVEVGCSDHVPGCAVLAYVYDSSGLFRLTVLLCAAKCGKRNKS